MNIFTAFDSIFWFSNLKWYFFLSDQPFRKSIAKSDDKKAFWIVYVLQEIEILENNAKLSQN